MIELLDKMHSCTALSLSPMEILWKNHVSSVNRAFCLDLHCVEEVPFLRSSPAYSPLAKDLGYGVLRK